MERQNSVYSAEEVPKIIDNTFEFVKEIGKGGEAIVCLYRGTTAEYKGKLYAVKIASKSNTNLNLEALLLRQLKDKVKSHLGDPFMPEMIRNGTNGEFRFMIITYLPETLEDQIKREGFKKVF